MADTFPQPYRLPAELRHVIAQIRELEESLADRRRRLGELASAPQPRRADALIRLRASLGRVEVEALYDIRAGITAAIEGR